jgi:hypothetical protein
VCMGWGCFDELGSEMLTARSHTDVEANGASTSEPGPEAPLLISANEHVEQARGGMKGEDPSRKPKTQALLVSQLPLDLLRDRAER